MFHRIRFLFDFVTWDFDFVAIAWSGKSTRSSFAKKWISLSSEICASRINVYWASFQVTLSPCKETEEEEVKRFEVMSPKLALMANYTFYKTFSCVADSRKTPFWCSPRNRIFILFFIFYVLLQTLRQQIPVAHVFLLIDSSLRFWNEIRCIFTFEFWLFDDYRRYCIIKN